MVCSPWVGSPVTPLAKEEEEGCLVGSGEGAKETESVGSVHCCLALAFCGAESVGYDCGSRKGGIIPLRAHWIAKGSVEGGLGFSSGW